ncbi:LPXTG cell wall anchor domain-containing protein [Enterococcus sp. 669A]|uniref:LPXTG cell wall anchor domain-containing protein n=1 Tax=Candidatus Enterococcus moelleringii TaxID=2815325 RepID=A0ABS3LCL8_9ENTE|nr:LPXTG cell wall anchor domain-containing protein [Enterococcus sp. 669A]MBO1306481.1 LPXTG cell wall anchor domain-containing protein [Enterococcus sp. 669A]
MDNEIQIYGRLGIPADDTPQNTPTEPAAPSEETTAGQLVPRYTVEQQQTYPKTGETNQAFFFSLLGILMVVIVVWVSRGKRREQNQG